MGNEVSVQGIEDSHVANMIQWLKKYNHPDTKFLYLMEEEAKLRGLSDEYLEKAPYPYKDGKGDWIIWCYNTGAPKSVGRYSR